MGTLLVALALYERRIRPQVREELRRWRAAAEQIPDPALREAALASIDGKGGNAEATAVFAILAPRRRRDGVVRASVSLQTAVDYLDTLSEETAADPLADGLALHGALADALSPGSPIGDWYACHPRREDGGYLAALVDACRVEVAALPGAATVLPLARHAARRCGEGQSHTHAAAGAASGVLEDWAARQPTAPGYRWWEVAAGASSSVAAHALIAAAADPGTTAEQAGLIDAAYFPPVGALTVLLDDLADRDEDLERGEHNYLGYYGSSEQTADRIALLADRAKASLAPLPQARRHRAILAGVAGFYLSEIAPAKHAAAAGSEYADPIRERLLESLGPNVRPVLAAMRLRRG